MNQYKNEIIQKIVADKLERKEQLDSILKDHAFAR
jgi:hypothetical protein